MIKINLLPFRAARKRENIKRQITIYALSVMCLEVLMGWKFLDLNSELSSLKEEQAKINNELKKYQKTIASIQKLEKMIKERETKLAVIKGLQKGKTGPVHLLEEIALAIPKDKLWLKSLSESKGNLSLTGTAMDNETVALFMTQLEQSKYISSVDLQSTRMRSLAQYKLRVSDFVLACKTYAFQEKKAAPKKGRRGKGGR